MHHSSVGGLLWARISFMFGIILCLPQFSSNFICCFSCFLINSYSTLYYKCKVFLMIHLSVNYSILFAYSHFTLFSYCHPWNRADQTSSLLNPTVIRYVLKNGCGMKKRESLSFYKKQNSIVSLWIKQSWNFDWSFSPDWARMNQIIWRESVHVYWQVIYSVFCLCLIEKQK